MEQKQAHQVHHLIILDESGSMTDHDVEKFADSIAIQNHLTFKKDEEGIQQMFQQERNARQRYSEVMRKRNYESSSEDNTNYFD